jgi:hypothetical protein
MTESTSQADIGTAPPTFVVTVEAVYSKCRLACLARRRSIQCAARTPFALKNLRALLATDSNVRHASVAFNQAMAWLYH